MRLKLQIVGAYLPQIRVSSHHPMVHHNIIKLRFDFIAFSEKYLCVGGIMLHVKGLINHYPTV